MHKKDGLCRREKKKEGAVMYREHTKTIKIGNQVIGGGHPVLIQSMTNTKTEDVAATVAQILTLEKAGCQIIRCAVPTMEAARALGEYHSLPGHRRYDPSIPDRRSVRRSQISQTDPENIGTSKWRHRSRILSDLRKNADRSDRSCQ